MEHTERFEASKSNEGRFRILIEAITDYAIYMLDPDGTITSWNPGARRLKGYEESEIIGENFSRFYTEEDRKARLPQRALEIAAREGKFENEGWRVRKDGTKFRAYVVIDPIRDSAGRVAGFAKITRDITERMNTARALEEAREALLQSQKMEAIGHLTGGVAHDFNNLLMAIQASLELLQRRLRPGDPKISQLIDNALQGTRRGAALTQRMLAFARRQELTLAPLDVHDVVERMINLLQSSLGPSIRVETRFPSELPKVNADANQLELALLNLAINGRDAMPNGGTITIGAAERTGVAGTGRYLCISVTDTGIGMDDETLQRAMEPFFTTKGVGKGTGLGLPMVHGMAEQSGGKLVLRSTLGKGTVAELCLPVAPRETNQPALDTDRHVFSPVDRKLAILTVDDDPLVALNTAALLEELGHEVYSAPSALHALDILQREKNIDLIITDQLMPGMTGSELAKRIRAENAELPIILATGYAELAPGEGGGLPRLTKPFGQRELAEAIARAVTH